MSLQQKQIVAAFLIGCLVGAAAGSKLEKTALHRFWEHGPRTERLLKKLSGKLDLNGGQQEATKKIIEKHHAEIMALQKQTSEKFAKIRLDMRSDLRKILNPDQQKKFQAMTARWDAEHPNPPLPPPDEADNTKKN